jgi:hypothetical protein
MTKIKLRQIKNEELADIKNDKQYREAIWKIIEQELSKVSFPIPGNNPVSSWLFGS